MRSVRMLLGGIGFAAVLAGVSACGAAQANASGLWVEVSPSSVKAGSQVGLRADCADNSSAATVTAKAFGTVTVQPLNSLLQGEAHVPDSTPVGSYTVTLTCGMGATATTTLWVSQKGSRQSLGPHTGGGFLAQGKAPGLAERVADAPAWLVGGVGVLGLSTAVAGFAAYTARRRRRRPSP